MVSYRGSLWVIGGRANDDRGRLIDTNDVWRSADGAVWELVTEAAAFLPREGHRVVVFRPTFTSYKVSGIAVNLPPVQTVVIAHGRFALLRLAATGGVGELRYDLLADEHGVVELDADGVLAVTAYLQDQDYATVSVRVRDTDACQCRDRCDYAVFCRIAVGRGGGCRCRAGAAG